MLDLRGDPVDHCHQEQDQEWGRVVERAFPGQVSMEEIKPVDGSHQEGEQSEEVMHGRAALLVEDAPHKHEADEDSGGALLSEKVADLERLSSFGRDRLWPD